MISKLYNIQKCNIINIAYKELHKLMKKSKEFVKSCLKTGINKKPLKK